MPERNVQKSFQDKHLKKKSIMQTLLDEYNKQPKVVEDSISRKLLNSAKASKKQLQDTEKPPSINTPSITRNIIYLNIHIFMIY